MNRRLFLSIALLFSCGPASAQIPNVLAAAHCVRSYSVLLCADQHGNYYSVAKVGSTLSTSGFDVASAQHWSQTTSQYGRFNFFSGITSSGKVWVGSNRKLGWDLRTRLSTSDGDQLRLTCNRLSGCQ